MENMMEIKISDIQTSKGIIQKIVLENDHHMHVELLSYGASIYQIQIDGKDKCVGPTDIEDFMTSQLYYGKTIGRMSGRISTQPFLLNDQMHQIHSFGSDVFQLHGGQKGFSFQQFTCIKKEVNELAVSVTLQYKSPHLEEGYPGELTLEVTYTLDQHQTLKISFDAESTQDTLANFTNHAYFNLLGEPHQILDHSFLIPASRYVQRDAHFTYLGVKEVDEIFAFRKSKKLIKSIQSFHGNNPGYDHLFLLDSSETIGVNHPNASYQLRINSDYPAVVFFTHNLENKALNERFPQKGRYSCFALECQYEPGHISQEGFNQLILKKGEHYHHFIQYQFIKNDSL